MSSGRKDNEQGEEEAEDEQSLWERVLGRSWAPFGPLLGGTGAAVKLREPIGSQSIILKTIETSNVFEGCEALGAGHPGQG